MHKFLTANRAELIARCRAKVAQRAAPGATEKELDHGITIFLEQLIKTLQVEQTSEPLRSRKVSGLSGGDDSAMSEMGVTAAEHGRELLQHGFTIEEVVHDYGDLCQSITELALEQNASIGIVAWTTPSPWPSPNSVISATSSWRIAKRMR